MEIHLTMSENSLLPRSNLSNCVSLWMDLWKKRTWINTLSHTMRSFINSSTTRFHSKSNSNRKDASVVLSFRVREWKQDKSIKLNRDHLKLLKQTHPCYTRLHRYSRTPARDKYRFDLDTWESEQTHCDITRHLSAWECVCMCVYS